MKNGNKLRATVVFEWDVPDEELHCYDAKTLEDAAKYQEKCFENGSIGLEDVLCFGEVASIKVEAVEAVKTSKRKRPFPDSKLKVLTKQELKEAFNADCGWAGCRTKTQQVNHGLCNWHRKIVDELERIESSRAYTKA